MIITEKTNEGGCEGKKKGTKEKMRRKKINDKEEGGKKGKRACRRFKAGCSRIKGQRVKVMSRKKYKKIKWYRVCVLSNCARLQQAQTILSPPSLESSPPLILQHRA